ncbi:Undecaprenyl-phosphate 4-deoxy-4-formamido-L-arabinose transferase [subsurface metagenome]
MAKESLSIIIPAYNEEKGIDATITKLKVMNKDYEIIVIDDGSTDNTYQIAKETGVKIIRHPYNKGYGAALKTGVRAAEFSFTTTLTLAMVKEGYNLKYVPVKTFWRTGKSEVRPFRDGFRFILLILGTINLFSPLKIFLPIALILSIIGVIDILHGIICYRNISDPALLLVLSTILIFFFGLLAECRVYLLSKSYR